MTDGKRERVVIACVTFDTYKISDPVIYYEATKVHLIHYVKDPDEEGNVYVEFYNRVVDLIKAGRGDIPIIKHMENVTDFATMLRVTYNIMFDEYAADPDADVFVNISAGSSEYAAASIMSAMMFPSSIPFSVRTKDYFVSTGSYFDENNVPIGLAKSVRPPKTVARYDIEPPDETLVLGLSVLDALTTDQGAPRGPEVVECLRMNGIWFRKQAPEPRSDAVYYHRDFVKRWEEQGWVFRDDHEKRYYLTERGKMVLNTFYRTEQSRLILDRSAIDTNWE